MCHVTLVGVVYVLCDLGGCGVRMSCDLGGCDVRICCVTLVGVV